MNHRNDDRELVDFLKQYRPPVPPANPALEDRLFDAIATTPQPTTVTVLRRSQSRSTHSVAWLVPSAIAAGLVATLVGYQTLMPAQPTAAELANLETFAENNWQGTFSNTSSDEEASLFGDVTAN